MLTYTVYSEAGGVGKTTLSANLAVAHARAGLDVLVIDMDPQDGSISYLFDVDEARSEGAADNIVRHMIGRPQGSFADLVHETEHGVDVVPSHNMLERLTELLLKTAELEEDTNPDPDYEYPMYEQLFRVLREADVPSTYDVLIIDPPATTGPQLYNALYATRNLVIPVELSGKGEQSVSGLQDLVEGLESELEINIGVLAAVPNEVKNTSDQRSYAKELEELGFDVPVSIRDRTSMFEGCWRQQCSAFTFIEEHRDRKRDYEVETLEKFEQLAEHLAAQVELEVTA
ncbi:Cellulose biosynthesis protein BcsQ [Halogranum gelatinilyticum]|uniref:Cellulose biosynthesis protein BcsQ n=1 Tax=Halogranum gelatinilyticum TaxID=660521 RepID=A0A1H0AAW2_9EURY|nr:ParA family protein [Halogranum gelatinilyticum]SDN30615.1 Cellulose biosynthesis protein BcsQ [Halogranum gelatinilyticum]